MRALLLISLISFLFFPDLARAADQAIINSEKALIYADADLSTPIGFLRRGKSIIVGSNPLKNGIIFTVVLPGRIAYIQAKDLKIEKDNNSTQKVTEHNIEILEKPPEEIFSINNYITPMVSTMEMGSQWKDLQTNMQDAEGQPDTRINYWRLLWEHRDQRFKLNWGMGLDFMGKEMPHFKFSAAGIEANINYSFIRTALLSMDVFTGLLGYPLVKATNDLALDPNRIGKMWGYQYGAQARLFPYSQWGAVGGMMYTSLSLSMDPIVTQKESTDLNDPVYSQKITQIKGWAMFLGISYKL